MVNTPQVNFTGGDVIANQFKNRDQVAAEQGRQSKYPFSAGPNGSFQIYPDPTIVDGSGNPVVDTVLKYQDGGPALTIRPGAATYGSKQQLRINDLSGNAMLQTDESAGYGLSAPIVTMPLPPLFGGGGFFSVPAGTEVAIAQLAAIFYNPSIQVTGTFTVLTTANGSTFSVTNFDYRVLVTDGTTTISSSTTTGSGAQFFTRRLLLPANFMNEQGVTVQVLVKPVSTAFFVIAGEVSGGSKAVYDADVGSH
jgi:hypothetical protein